MKGLREFQIPFVGLRIGTHNFNYDIDGKFFSHFEESLVHDCKVNVRLELEKKETFFALKFFIDGAVDVECDRCLVPFSKEIFGDYTCYIKFAEDTAGLSDEDEVIFIAREETMINVSQLIYEYINLCLPMQKLGCKTPGEEPQCNKEVLKHLQDSLKHENTEPDPRWEALKNIKNKN